MFASPPLFPSFVPSQIQRTESEDFGTALIGLRPDPSCKSTWQKRSYWVSIQAVGPPALSWRHSHSPSTLTVTFPPRDTDLNCIALHCTLHFQLWLPFSPHYHRSSQLHFLDFLTELLIHILSTTLNPVETLFQPFHLDSDTHYFITAPTIPPNFYSSQAP